MVATKLKQSAQFDRPGLSKVWKVHFKKGGHKLVVGLDVDAVLSTYRQPGTNWNVKNIVNVELIDNNVIVNKDTE